jgi:hypothetical protein
METLAFLDLYGLQGTRYEDSRVVDMLNDQNSIVGPPRVLLLDQLRQLDKDWLHDHQDGNSCVFGQSSSLTFFFRQAWIKFET